jgi:hypothetical protein
MYTKPFGGEALCAVESHLRWYNELETSLALI